MQSMKCCLAVQFMKTIKRFHEIKSTDIFVKHFDRSIDQCAKPKDTN